MSDRRFRVPPYAMTGGRTQADIDLSVETMLSATKSGSPEGEAHEAAVILSLCAHPTSVAEIAALAKLPYQVTKILAADLVNRGSLSMASARMGATSGRPDVSLLNKVLDGLQGL